MDHWTRVRTKFKEISIQEVFIVIACLSIVYLLRAKESFTVIPLWRKELSLQFYHNGKYPVGNEKLPLPLVTDLESDGTTEIIIITNDLKLELYTSPFESNPQATSLAYLIMQKSVNLHVQEFSSHSNARHPSPIALESGFIKEYNATSNQQRKQVIVIGFQNRGLLCYDSDLNLLWHKEFISNISDSINHYKIKDFAVSVTSYPLSKDDEGSIFVSFGMTHSKNGRSTETGTRQSKPVMHQMGAHMHTTSNSENKFSHYSTYALNAADGSLRWSHSESDCHTDEDVKTGFSHWKLEVHNTDTHAGEVHWTKYKTHILQHMPHHWRELSDTSIELIDLKKSVSNKHHHSHKSLKKVATFSPLVDILGMEDDHIAGLPFGGMMPHNPHEHIKTPSSVLSHYSDGIELLRLDTGRPITRLSMQDSKCVFADIEGDLSVEKVCIDSDVCNAKIEQVHPTSQYLFEAPLCEVPSFFGPVTFMAALQSHKYMNEDERLALSPVLVKSIGKKHGVFAHLMGRKLKSEQKGYDSIFVTSSGRMSSYSPHGNLNWQVLISTGWDSYYVGQGSELDIGYHQRQEIYDETFQPSMTPFSLLSFGKMSHVLILGWSSLSVVDLYNGNVLAEHSIPCPPIQKPVIGDVNDDGKNDIIVSCPFGYVALILEQSNNHLYTVVTAILVITIILLLSWCCKPEEEEEDVDPEREKYS